MPRLPRQPRLRGGIRVRVTVAAVLVVTAMLIMTGYALTASQRRLLTNNLDDGLRGHAAELIRQAVVLSTDLSTDPSGGAGPPPPLIGSGDDDAIAQIATAEGQVLNASANFLGQRALGPPANQRLVQVRSVRLLPGEPTYRIFSQRSGPFVVHSASPLDDIEDSVAALRVGLILAIPVVAALLGLLIWGLIGQTLQPVEAIRREVTDISGRSLHRRVPAPRGDDEIARLAHTMNAMLDRLEQASHREQRFVADASHELRSPLTRMRTELEVDLLHPATADVAGTQRSLLAEIQQLQRLVEDLLVLARHDAEAEMGTARTAYPAVDLDDIVLRETAELRRLGPWRVEVGAVSAAQVSGKAEDLSRVVRNLLDNARRHAHRVITVSLTETDGLCRLTVTDDGSGVAPEAQERIFERFARADDARRGADGGTGLGLAICREILRRHRGTIRVESNGPDGASFIVELPGRSLEQDEGFDRSPLSVR